MKSKTQKIYTEADRQAARAKVAEMGIMALTPLAPMMDVGMAMWAFRGAVTIQDMQAALEQHPFMASPEFEFFMEEKNDRTVFDEKMAMLRDALLEP